MAPMTTEPKPAKIDFRGQARRFVHERSPEDVARQIARFEEQARTGVRDGVQIPREEMAERAQLAAIMREEIALKHDPAALDAAISALVTSLPRNV